MRQAVSAVVRAARVANLLESFTAARVAPSAQDAGRQLAELVHAGFVSETGARQLRHLSRYVSGLEHRLGKLREKPERDRELMARANRIENRFADLLKQPAAAEARWLLQELRVSLFAQQLGTAEPVSEQRVLTELQRLAGTF